MLEKKIERSFFRDKRWIWTIFIAYFMTRIYLFYSLPWNSYIPLIDSLSFLRGASASFFSKDIFLIRPFLYPVFLKICHQKLELIFHLQLLFSVFAWFFCASVLSLLAYSKKYKIILLTSVLIYSFSAYINLWDVKLLAESLSISSLVSFLSCILLIFLRGLTVRRLIAVLLLLAVLVFLKDSAVYLVPLIMLPLVIFFVRRGLHRKDKFLLIAAVAISLVSGLMVWESTATADVGKRWLHSLNNVLSTRVFYLPQAVVYFKEQGMVGFNDDTFFIEKDRYNYAKFLMKEHSPLSIWIRTHGKSVYQKFLLTHPLYTFLEPISNAKYWVNLFRVPALSSNFDYNSDSRISVVATMCNGLSKRVCYLLICWFLWVSFRRKYVFQDIIIRSVLYGLVITFLFSLIIWHADSMGVIRHQLETYLLMLFCFTVGAVRAHCLSRLGNKIKQE